jgi:hypothetical protein
MPMPPQIRSRPNSEDEIGRPGRGLAYSRTDAAFGSLSGEGGRPGIVLGFGGTREDQILEGIRRNADLLHARIGPSNVL